MKFYYCCNCVRYYVPLGTNNKYFYCEGCGSTFKIDQERIDVPKGETAEMWSRIKILEEKTDRLVKSL